eukprot:CAMPEP_0170399958 /NCGR_PEP_ID=MMETSP0117_2-20130122/24240_1 /TAXON_ID=400756 /ORGANISM="Durinskia baltica, Strain CSIRO CS-38" /LENGTH=44 /DNA_ID= /DNA_START= /DNA_END= /DNA_ORIENTATION=
MSPEGFSFARTISVCRPHAATCIDSPAPPWQLATSCAGTRQGLR